MSKKTKFGLIASLICAILFFLSGAALQRGWSLWTSAIASICVVLSAMAVGSVDEEGGAE